jgi:hypothetical protein
VKVPGFNPSGYEVKHWFQSLLSKFNLYRCTRDMGHGSMAMKPGLTMASKFVSGGTVVGLYKLNPVDESLKAPGFNPES